MSLESRLGDQVREGELRIQELEDESATRLKDIEYLEARLVEVKEEGDSFRTDFGLLSDEFGKAEAELADICKRLRGAPGPNGSRLDGDGGLAAAVMAACDGYEMENGDLKATIESLKAELAKVREAVRGEVKKANGISQCLRFWHRREEEGLQSYLITIQKGDYESLALETEDLATRLEKLAKGE